MSMRAQFKSLRYTRSKIKLLSLKHSASNAFFTVASKWARRRLKSPVPRWFAEPFVQAKIREISQLRVTGLCGRNSPVTDEFPSQRASNTEHVSVWWRHHIAISSLNPSGTFVMHLVRRSHTKNVVFCEFTHISNNKLGILSVSKFSYTPAVT